MYFGKSFSGSPFDTRLMFKIVAIDSKNRESYVYRLNITEHNSNTPPFAVALANKSKVKEYENFQLDGSKSKDPDVYDNNNLKIFMAASAT